MCYLNLKNHIIFLNSTIILRKIAENHSVSTANNFFGEMANNAKTVNQNSNCDSEYIFAQNHYNFKLMYVIPKCKEIRHYTFAG